MVSEAVARVLHHAVEDTDFRRRTLANLGQALAEASFVLSDEEMATLRTFWEPLRGLSERAAYERLQALARTHRQTYRM